jgi:hypothetical protein
MAPASLATLENSALAKFCATIDIPNSLKLNENQPPLSLRQLLLSLSVQAAEDEPELTATSTV